MINRPYTCAERVRMSKMWVAGLSYAEIGKNVGRTKIAVADFVARNRHWFPKRRCGRHAKINTDELIRLLAEGASKQEVCDKYGVTRNAIGLALQRRRKAEAASQIGEAA